MNTKLLNLRNILDIQRWQTIQDELAKITGLAIVTVDYKGNAVTNHSNRTDFCNIMRNNDSTLKKCQKCDSRGGLEAARRNKPYTYFCHANVIDTAIPIVINDNYIGAIMVGQVLPEDQKKASHLEKIVSSINEEELKEINPNLEKYLKNIIKLSCEKINLIVNCIYNISNYIVEEAITKNALFELNQTFQKQPQHIFDIGKVNGANINHMKDVKNLLELAIVEKNINDNMDEKNISISSLIKPAIDYINQNKSEKIEMVQMAKLCHLSPGYFSKLFKKEMNMNFSTYMMNYKIGISKMLLERTDTSVNEISNNLGFNECGYFIKLFYKYEGVTPLIYRKNYKKI